MTLRPNSTRIFQVALLFVLWLAACEWSRGSTFFYCYGADQAGVAAVEVNERNGSMSSQVTMEEALQVPNPKKLAVSSDGRELVVTSDANPKVAVLRVDRGIQPVSTLEVNEATSDVRAWADKALLAAEHGAFYEIDLKTGEFTKTWNARDGLKPSGHKGENILLLPDKGIALVSFQKDSKKGKHFGNRVVALGLTDLAPKWDLQLPRDRPELHLQGNLKEQGPSPEVVLVAPKSDTLVLTLDLYGALAFAKLSSALSGKLEGLQYVPTSADGSWGKAFPDRARIFEAGGKEFVLVSNASQNGGLTLFDVAARKMIQKFPVSAGCETPVLLEKSGKLVTAVSGKIKTREEAKVEKDSLPGNELLVVDSAPLAKGKSAGFEAIPFEKCITHVEAVNPGANDLLFLVLGESDSELVVYDLATRKIVERQPAKGNVAGVAGHHSSGNGVADL